MNSNTLKNRIADKKSLEQQNNQQDNKQQNLDTLSSSDQITEIIKQVPEYSFYPDKQKNSVQNRESQGIYNQKWTDQIKHLLVGLVEVFKKMSKEEFQEIVDNIYTVNNSAIQDLTYIAKQSNFKPETHFGRLNNALQEAGYKYENQMKYDEIINKENPQNARIDI